MTEYEQGGMIPAASLLRWAEAESDKPEYFIPANPEITARNMRILEEAVRRVKVDGDR